MLETLHDWLKKRFLNEENWYFIPIYTWINANERRLCNIRQGKFMMESILADNFTIFAYENTKIIFDFRYYHLNAFYLPIYRLNSIV